MKTQRRHELQTNVLADWLGKQIEAVKPYSQYIVGGIILLVAIVGFIVYQSSGQSAQKASTWREYFASLDKHSPEELEKMAKANGDSVAALWALQSAGDIYLDEGIGALYRNNDFETAKESLSAAKKNYEKVLSRAKRQTMLQQRAQYALAQANECLGELEEAKKQYSKLAQASPDSAIGKLAARAAERLSDPKTAEFYKELYIAKIDPKAEFPDLPERPDLSFPGEDDLFVVPVEDESSDGDGEKSADAPKPKDDSKDDTTKKPTKDDKKDPESKSPSKEPESPKTKSGASKD